MTAVPPDAASRPSSPLVDHPLMDYPIRGGTFLDHQTSTYTLAETAVREGRFADAADLGRYTVREAVEAHELYRDWIAQIPVYLREHGLTDAEIAAECARVEALVALPGGVRFDPDAGWAAYQAGIEAFAAACAAERGADALALLEGAREIWRDTHDRKCDWVYGLLDVAARRLGEGCIGDLWDVLMAPMYEYYGRYDVDVHPWPRSFELLMQIALEALRGHLSGPGRRGDIEVFEEEDRWGMRFDPCGSGGRTYRDDPEAGVGPRMEAPFNYAVTTGEHDWAWNKKGVCLYCAHCCELMERVPIQKFGYPARVVDPPTWPDGRAGKKCTWYVYKDPSLVPEEIYRRVGETKPAVLGGRARAAGTGAGR